ncbi:MAG: pyridoxal-phosphate dependent enzyme, partial [Desulfurobacteriaceae bacterium]
MDFVLLVSRLQFAMTAFFHFIFVPLTLGLSTLSAIVLTLYYKTGKEIYKEMAKFWAKLFAINFALGVATGLVHEFEFGMNWSVYSRFVGDIFGAPLAIEGLLAFFMESTFIGVFLFGWDKVPKGVHLLAAWLSSIGSNLSALWILVANGWMQHPTGAEVVKTLAGKRAEMTDWWAVVFNPVADVKFWHTATAGMILASVFVLSVRAYHLLKHQHVEFFTNSAYIALIFGLIASVGEIIIGDIHAHEVAKTQPTKLAAMEELGASIRTIPRDAWFDLILHSHDYPGMVGLFIHPASNRDVMAGQGTIGLEILEDLPDVNAVITPFGGGGLTAGVASAIQLLKPSTR